MRSPHVDTDLTERPRVLVHQCTRPRWPRAHAPTVRARALHAHGRRLRDKVLEHADTPTLEALLKRPSVSFEDVREVARAELAGGGFPSRTRGEFVLPPADRREPARTERLLATPWHLRRRSIADTCARRRRPAIL